MTTIEGLENLNTINVTDMSDMFRWCTELTSLDLSQFYTGSVTTMNNMFASCGELESLDLLSFDISKVENTRDMFSSCSKLKSIYCNGDWSTSETLTQSENMFYGCTVLVGGQGTTYDATKVDKTYARLDGGASAPGYFTIKGDANGDGKVTITDAVGIVNKILGNPSTQFHEPAADVNHDHEITITDAVGVVNIILNDIGEALAPAMETPQEQEPVVEPE